MLHRILIPLFVTLFTADLKGQDIFKHRWENRLLLVLSKEYSDIKLTEQLSVLNNCKQGLTERKLLVYQILPDKYKISTTYGNEETWQLSPVLYEQFSAADTPFEIILIGLDGGIKLRKEDQLACEELWAVIDKMPMRQAEIRRQNNSK